MTKKTDFKFVLLVVAVLGAVFFGLWRALYAGPLTAARVRSYLQRDITRTELAEKLGKKIDVMWPGGAHGAPLQAIYVLEEPHQQPQTYHLIFDQQEHLKQVYVEVPSLGRPIMRPIQLN